jgi:hypothetical protein
VTRTPHAPQAVRARRGSRRSCFTTGAGCRRTTPCDRLATARRLGRRAGRPVLRLGMLERHIRPAVRPATRNQRASVHGEDPTDLADVITAAEWSAPFPKHHHVHEAGRASFDAQVTLAGGLWLALAEQGEHPPGYRKDDPVTAGRAADYRADGAAAPSN